MRYSDGREVRAGDRVRLWGDCYGVVVFSVDGDEYTPEYPREQWSYLGNGVMIDSDKAGLIHYTEPDEDLVLMERSDDT
jgi:hypothetical protein